MEQAQTPKAQGQEMVGVEELEEVTAEEEGATVAQVKKQGVENVTVNRKEFV